MSNLKLQPGHLEVAASNWSEVDDLKIDESVGVALSGGGVRAALFSLGVLVCLVDSGANRSVASIASVSGGSIVNAGVAQACDFASLDGPDEFEPVAKNLAESLAMRGAFAFSRTNLVQLIAMGLRILPSFAVAILISVRIGDNSVRVDHVHWAAVVPVFVVAALIAVLLARGAFQRFRYSAMLKSDGAVLKEPRVRDFVDGGTHHVLVSTDLMSGRPVYMSRDFVLCSPYGWGTPDSMATADAIYASAAFPVVFPPLSIRTAKFGFQNGVATPPFPKKLRLADGGVYNNLGTDWFNELSRQPEALWKFGELPLSYRPLDRVIVVNASAPSKPLHRLWEFQRVARTMSVLYDNTVRPRVEGIQNEQKTSAFGSLVIDIAESPVDLAQRLGDLSLGPISDRARSFQTRLECLPPKYWAEFARQTSTTPTKLSRAGREVAARLMLHGYLSTLVVLNALYGVDVDHVRGEQYFLCLTGRKLARDGEDDRNRRADQAANAPGGPDDKSTTIDRTKAAAAEVV